MSGSCMATWVCLTLGAIAQSTLPPGVTIPPNTPDTVEQTIPRASESPHPLPFETPTPPSKPDLRTPPIQEPLEKTPLSSDRFFIKKVEVQGSTILREEIAALIQLYENRRVTFDELRQLSWAIAQLYINNGYVTSGAFLPNNQDLSTGIVQIQVVEGELEQIEIGGLRRLRARYVTSRLEKATSTPLNQQRLETALQVLQLDPLIEQVNANLDPGSTPGRSILRVSLKEAPTFHAAIAVDNNQSPSIGSIQGSIEVSHDNLLGFGDRLSAQYGRTEGLDLYNISYSIPVNARNGTVSFRYSNDDSNIIEEDFREYGVRSEAQTSSFSFRQPLLRAPNSEVALSLGLDLRRSQTYILDDMPFTFTAGAEEGKSNVTVLRFSQDWVDRGVKRVLAARSQFSLGINAFNATINDTGTDGRFFPG